MAVAPPVRAPGGQLLKAKLQPPRVTPNLLLRPRLFARLEETLQRKLTFISAAAGYGKTTLLSQFLSTTPAIRAAWYQLGEEDRDPILFLRYLLAAIRRQLPQAVKEAENLLEGVRDALQARQRVVPALINGFAAREGRHLLVVLDDYHLVDGEEAITALMGDLLDHQPSTLHLIVATRRPPRLRLGRLRAQGQLLEFSGQDLAFTPEEVRALFTSSYHLNLSDDILDLVWERTEGWITALFLLSTSWRGKSVEQLKANLARLQGTGRDVAAFLTEEVWETFPVDLQRFLLDTAVLEWLEPQACGHLSGRSIPESASRLAELAGCNLFTTLVDEARQRYRYHHLFRGFLLERLGKEDPDRLAALHLQAGEFFREHGEAASAVEHYLQAEAHELALRIIGEAGNALLWAGQVETVRRWIARFPAHVREDNPDILRLRADIEDVLGHEEEALVLSTRAAERAEERADWTTLARAIGRLATILINRGRSGRAVEVLERAQESVGNRDLRARAIVLSNLAWPLYRLGDDRAGALNQEAMAIFERLGDRRGLGVTLRNAAAISGSRGVLHEAIRFEQKALAIFRELGSRLGECNTLLNLATYQLNAGRATEALTTATSALNQAQEMSLPAGMAVATLIQADAQKHLGAPEAEETYRRTIRLAEELEFSLDVVDAYCGLSIIYRQKGNIHEALRCARRALEVAQKTDEALPMAIAKGELGLVTILSEDRTRGLTLLDDAIATLKGGPHQIDVYPCLIYRAWARLESGATETAREDLGEILSIAEAKGLDHLFLQEPDLALPLLGHALKEDLGKSYVLQLLAGLGARGAEVIEEFLKDPRREVREACLKAWNALRPVPQESALPPARLMLLGSFNALIRDVPVPEEAWGGPQAKAVFLYLVLHRHRPVPDEELLEALWPGEEAVGKAKLYTMIWRIRRALEPEQRKARGSAYVAKLSGGYQFQPRRGCWIDAEAFEQTLSRGRALLREGKDADAIRALEEAVVLYRGDLLADTPYAEWCHLEREATRRQMHEALLQLGRLYARQQDYGAAIRHLSRLLQMEPTNEEAHRELMRAYHLSGRKAEGVRQFQRCQAVLREELDIAPSDETEQLYESIVREKVERKT